jgi:hypothetical protein
MAAMFYELSQSLAISEPSRSVSEEPAFRFQPQKKKKQSLSPASLEKIGILCLRQLRRRIITVLLNHLVPGRP